MTDKLASSGLGALERFATTARADFRFAPLNALVLVGIMVLGLAVHLSVYSFSVDAVALALGSALVLAILLHLAQVWRQWCSSEPPTACSSTSSYGRKAGSCWPPCW